MPTYLGRSFPRVDALDKVTGTALFPGDINLPDQLHLKVLFAGRPHAIIKSIYLDNALSIEGVITILTAKDVPVNEYGLIMNDQPVLCGPGSPIPYADRVRFIGDQVALCIAENEQIAKQAIKLIEVVYEDLPIVTSLDSALENGTELVHPGNETNVICNYRIRKGNTIEGFQQADVIIESEIFTPQQEHAYLQPEAGLSYLDEQGRITVIVGGQWAHEDREQIAHALNLPEEKIRVIYPAVGGAFGGREDMSIQIILALSVMKLNEMGINRPVKIIWSREESIFGHHKRHPYKIKSKWGATKDGRIISAEVDITADGGAYAYTSTKVLGNTTLMCTGPYEISNVKVDSRVVYTNNIPSGAFRGFGGPQATFSAEMQMNKLAEALNMDSVEIRLINAIKDGSISSVNTPFPKGVTMPQVIEKCAVESGWSKKDHHWRRQKSFNRKVEIDNSHIKKGIGFACAFKNVGFSFGAPEECWAEVELRGGEEIEEAVIRHAGAEVGQGAHSAFQQMTAEALNLPTSKVTLEVSDTGSTRNSGSASASRMTFMAGNAIKGAVDLAVEKWRNEERPSVGSYRYVPPKTTPYDPETGESIPNFAYGYVAQAVEVEVDTETGRVSVKNVTSTNDVGRAVNPQQIEGQIEGAVAQAVGFTLIENFIQKDGQVLTPDLTTYLIPSIGDVPESLKSVILEYPDPRGPWGIRGMAEMPFLPVAPAIAGAIHDAVGIWFDQLPITPEIVLRGLKRF